MGLLIVFHNNFKSYTISRVDEIQLQVFCGGFTGRNYAQTDNSRIITAMVASEIQRQFHWLRVC